MSMQLSFFPELTKPIAKFPSTRYQGSKLKFVDWIWEIIKDLPFQTALDAFGGTGSVAYRLKKEGKKVTYNDVQPFNYYIGAALVENDEKKISDKDIEEILSAHSGFIYPNLIASTFKDIYYTDEENVWLDIVSKNIRNMEDPYKQAMAYFALFQSCIIKRPYNLFHRKNLSVRLKDVERSFGNKKTWDTPFEVHFRKFIKEANDAVFSNGEKCISKSCDIFDIENTYDLVYIDTPYLNDKGVGIDYSDFYHFLNGLVDYDNWESRIDYNSKNFRLQPTFSVWNDSECIDGAFIRLFKQFKDSIIVVSYRSNGIPTIKRLTELLESIGKTVSVHYSEDIKYVLSNKNSKEVLIVAK